MAFPTTLDIFQSYSQVWGHAVTVYSATDVLSFCRAKDLASTIHTGSAAWHLYKCGQKKNGMYWRWEQSSSSVPCHYFIVVHVLFLSSKDKHDLGKTLIVRIIHFSRVFSRKKNYKPALHHVWSTEEVQVAQPSPKNHSQLYGVRALNSKLLETQQQSKWVIFQLHMTSLTKGPA